mmetsp:Transcript_2741/g.5416  ORF Transcript_2741/g.5416 Transcript_2741/m.5416 type:complete len:528 (-) Transcript_2741:244-1827(-)
MLRNFHISSSYIYAAAGAALVLVVFTTVGLLPTIHNAVIPQPWPDNLEEILGQQSALSPRIIPSNPPTTTTSTTNHTSTLLSDSLSNKPHLILHFGPAKTGTTSLQHELSLWKDRMLELDNVLYGGAYYGQHAERLGRLPVMGNFMDFSFACQRAMAQARHEWESTSQQQQQTPSSKRHHATLKEHLLGTVPCFQEVYQDLQTHHLRGTSLIFSNEKKSTIPAWKSNIHGYHGQPVPLDWLSLAAALGDEWNFVFVLGHRPYLDWIPSAKTQDDKYSPNKPRMKNWPDKGGREVRPLFPRETLVDHNETYDIFWENTLANMHQEPQALEASQLLPDNYWGRYPIPFLHSTEMYDRMVPYISIRFLHLYDPVPMRTNFLCHILPNSPRSCQASREADEQGQAEVVLNLGAAHTDWNWFDKLTMAALAQGMLKTERARYSLVNKVKRQHEEVWNRTLFDFPRKCPSRAGLYSLWDHSWKSEKGMLGDQANLTLHMELFLRNIRNAKYCEIDAWKTLQRKEWEQFFREIS